MASGNGYYGPMFVDKKPSTQFSAILRAIGLYIIENLGDRSVTTLKPEKLAAFYRTVGGNYDELFLKTPPGTISYIWQLTGCPHSLQPVDFETHKSFQPPTIPALTPKGWIRWQTIELLLDPQTHVPFIQYAVKNWELRDTRTGEVFPPDLPADLFPSAPDPALSQWYEAQSKTLAEQAEGAMPPPRSTTHHAAPRTEARAEAHPEPRTSSAPTPGRPVRMHRTESDYFTSGHRYKENVGRPPPPQHRRTRSEQRFGGGDYRFAYDTTPRHSPQHSPRHSPRMHHGPPPRYHASVHSDESESDDDEHDEMHRQRPMYSPRSPHQKPRTSITGKNLRDKLSAMLVSVNEPKRPHARYHSDDMDDEPPSANGMPDYSSDEGRRRQIERERARRVRREDERSRRPEPVRRSSSYTDGERRRERAREFEERRRRADRSPMRRRYVGEVYR